MDAVVSEMFSSEHVTPKIYTIFRSGACLSAYIDAFMSYDGQIKSINAALN